MTLTGLRIGHISRLEFHGRKYMFVHTKRRRTLYKWRMTGTVS